MRELENMGKRLSEMKDDSRVVTQEIHHKDKVIFRRL